MSGGVQRVVSVLSKARRITSWQSQAWACRPSRSKMVTVSLVSAVRQLLGRRAWALPSWLDQLLLAARYQVQKFSGQLNQAVAKWHSTGELPAQLLSAVGLVGRVPPRLEEAAAAVRVSQQDAARRRVLAPRKAPAKPDAGVPDGGPTGAPGGGVPVAPVGAGA